MRCCAGAPEDLVSPESDLEQFPIPSWVPIPSSRFLLILCTDSTEAKSFSCWIRWIKHWRILSSRLRWDRTSFRLTLSWRTANSTLENVSTIPKRKRRLESCSKNAWRSSLTPVKYFSFTHRWVIKQWESFSGESLDLLSIWQKTLPLLISRAITVTLRHFPVFSPAFLWAATVRRSREILQEIHRTRAKRRTWLGASWNCYDSARSERQRSWNDDEGHWNWTQMPIRLRNPFNVSNANVSPLKRGEYLHEVRSSVELPVHDYFKSTHLTRDTFQWPLGRSSEDDRQRHRAGSNWGWNRSFDRIETLQWSSERGNEETWKLKSILVELRRHEESSWANNSDLVSIKIMHHENEFQDSGAEDKFNPVELLNTLDKF